MSREQVDAAVARVRARAGDEAFGALAQHVADAMTAGEGTGVLHQAGVQEFLWYSVPKRFPPDEWGDAVAVAATLLDELGFDRYATIARSESTASLHDAWRAGRSTWRRKFASAVRASGVEPLDTDVLTWGTVFGPDEDRARRTVERALEAAIVAGGLVPGARRWKDTAGAITRATITAPLDLPPGQTLATLVTTERAEHWVRLAHGRDDRRVAAWRESAVRRVLGPVAPPDDAATIVAPVAWLLRHATGGIELTQSLYIARPLVLEAAETFGWWEWDKPPRSEVDLLPLGDVREVATEQRWIRRNGRRLTATAEGKRLATDAGALWSAVAQTLGGSHAFDRTVGELMAHRLLEGPASDDELVDAVGSGASTLGWQTRSGPLSDAQARSAMFVRWRWWRLLHVIDEDPTVWDAGAQRPTRTRTTHLTPAGRTTVLAYLRNLATGPRTDV
jgi:hypothetical protein